MATYSFDDARRLVIEQVAAHRQTPPVEPVPLEYAEGRVLAQSVVADRDYPPADRSVRDGFAVRAADLPGELRIAGEVRAGETWAGQIGPGEALEIMTGATVPPGADTVVMIEHVTVSGDRVRLNRAVTAGDFINRQACEAVSGSTLLQPGVRLGYPEIALLATVGLNEVLVCRRPVVAIVATGDEIVEVSETPAAHQIRNSNAHSLAAQVRRAGGEPRILPVARDTVEATAAVVAQGLEADLLVLSGGVSAGKYDVVERVLAGFDAVIYMDRVLIQPGQPLVFGRARERFFFGLPGNPASTMVCFEIFARAAVELLGGQTETALPLPEATLASDFRHRPGLTRFLPARLSPSGRLVTPVGWSGSGDVAALTRANAYLVADPDKPEYKAGERIRVLLR